MKTLNELRNFARQAKAKLARETGLAAFEVYCSTAEHRVARLSYTSDIPSRGVEEFKSLNADGFAVRIVMSRDAHEIGVASTAGDLSPEALREAIARARRSTVVDPYFPGLPSEPAKIATVSVPGGDLMRIKDREIAAGAWKIIGGAITAFNRGAGANNSEPGLVVGGDLSVIRDRIAIASSSFDDIRIDEAAHFSASVTALVEAYDAKGTATAIGNSAAEMQRASARLGRDAVNTALKLKDGERPAAGAYRVVLGPQPIAEIINYMVLPSLTTGAFQAASSAYHGRFGAQVMDPRLSLVDDPAAEQGAVHRRITCEGIPTARTELIRAGRLIGLLSTYYNAHRLATDAHRAEKLGINADEIPLFPARSGYRLGESAARRFDSSPGATGTNVFMRTREGVDDRALIAAVSDGIYIGRIWYTYPINGQRAGDFTCTVSGDSYVIRNGKIAAPLAPNCLRVNANIAQVFGAPLAVGRRPQPALVWGSAEGYFVPSIAAEGITLSAVTPKESESD